MKDLIIKALNEAYTTLEKRIPQTKVSTKYIDITNVNPFDLVSFMAENNVPKEACFDGMDNSYDAWYVGIVLLSWETNVPTTDKDKLKYCKEKFNTIASKAVFDTLTKEGYKKTGFNSGLLKDFKDTTVYDMYINKDFDRLVNYYSLSFSLSPEIKT